MTKTYQLRCCHTPEPSQALRAFCKVWSFLGKILSTVRLWCWSIGGQGKLLECAFFEGNKVFRNSLRLQWKKPEKYSVQKNKNIFQLSWKYQKSQRQVLRWMHFPWIQPEPVLLARDRQRRLWQRFHPWLGLPLLTHPVFVLLMRHCRVEPRKHF